MISISCNNLTKYYDTTLILENISFNINAGEKVGLIGRNGAGKTTLFKILTKNLEYDSGEIFYNKNLTLGYLKQENAFLENETLYDYCKKVFNKILNIEKEIEFYEHKISEYGKNNVNPPKDIFEKYSKLVDEFTKQEGYSIDSKIKGILRGMGFNDNDFLKNPNILSGGQKSRLNLAKLLLTTPDILLLDEPTNHLDINSVTWLENYISKYKGTVIIISHDRFFLDQTVDTIFEIENHKLLKHKGSYTDFVKYKEGIYKAKLKEFEKQEEEIKKQEEIIRRFKGHGTEKLAKRAKSREKRLNMIEKKDKPILENDKTKLKLTSSIESGYEVLKVRDISKKFDDKTVLKNISLDVYKNDKIGLIGANGIGKTTLFKILTNSLEATSGEFTLGHNVKCGYYDQEQLNLNENNNLIEEILDLKPMYSSTEVRKLLGAFLFKGEDVFKKISSLSGGEKGRLSLLKLMLKNSNFLLLDEPTNHLDISSKESLEDALLNYDSTILTISHDRYFLNKVCNKIMELTEDGIKVFLGNYDYYLEKKQEEKDLIESSSMPTITKTKLKEERKKERERSKEEKRRKKLIQKIEEDIQNLEDKIKNLELELCDEKIFSNHELSFKISNEIEELKKNIDKLYEEWENIV